MILLYKGLEDTLPSPVAANQSIDRETRIASLEETIRSRDKLIESLKNELMALKVIHKCCMVQCG